MKIEVILNPINLLVYSIREAAMSGIETLLFHVTKQEQSLFEKSE